MNPNLSPWQIPIIAWLIAQPPPPVPSLLKQYCVRAGGKEEKKAVATFNSRAKRTSHYWPTTRKLCLPAGVRTIGAGRLLSCNL
jgi:hypothetical protein